MANLVKNPTVACPAQRDRVNFGVNVHCFGLMSIDGSSGSSSKTLKRFRSWGHSLLDTFKRPEGEPSLSLRLKTYAMQRGISMFDLTAPPMPQWTSPSASQPGRQQQQYASASSSPPAASAGGPTHLIIMANGLFGKPDNWTVIAEQLREQLDPQQVLLHASQVNRLTETYDGIDVCGQRLADEVHKVVSQHPHLQRISVIGHSMGGLLVRYALGVLYDPNTKLIAGLQPCHFVSMATPHMGCDAEGLAQLPFIGWVESLRPLQKVLQTISVPTASALFKRTGRQFFLADGTPISTNLDGTFSQPASASGQPSRASSPPARSASQQPTLSPSSHPSASQLQTQSQPQAAFSTLASYAVLLRGYSSAAGPSAGTEKAAAAKGHRRSASLSGIADVKQEQPLLLQMTADHPERNLYFLSALQSFASRTCYANTGGDHLVGWANSSLRFMHQLPQLPPEHVKAKGVVLEDPFSAAWDLATGRQPGPNRATSPEDLPVDRTSELGRASAGNVTNDQASEMLHRLQSMPWRRIDVCFKGARFGFAHNNIQVTRRWMNFEGVQVAQHLASQLAALDACLAATPQPANPAGSAAAPLHINSNFSDLSSGEINAAAGGLASPPRSASPASPPTKLPRLSYERLQQRDGVSVEMDDDAAAMVLLPMQQRAAASNPAPVSAHVMGHSSNAKDSGAVRSADSGRLGQAEVPPTVAHFSNGGGAVAEMALSLPRQESAHVRLGEAIDAAIAAVETAGASVSHALDSSKLATSFSQARADVRAVAEHVGEELSQAHAHFTRTSQDRLAAAAGKARAVKLQAQAKAEAAAASLAGMSREMLDQSPLVAVGHSLSDFFDHAWAEHQKRRAAEAKGVINSSGIGLSGSSLAAAMTEQLFVPEHWHLRRGRAAGVDAEEAELLASNTSVQAGAGPAAEDVLCA